MIYPLDSDIQCTPLNNGDKSVICDVLPSHPREVAILLVNDNLLVLSSLRDKAVVGDF